MKRYQSAIGKDPDKRAKQWGPSIRGAERFLTMEHVPGRAHVLIICWARASNN